jgi:hypothetical protein
MSAGGLSSIERDRARRLAEHADVLRERIRTATDADDISYEALLGFTASRKTQTRNRGYIADYRPQAKTEMLLADVEAVLRQYRAHWPLTVRQIFYRLVAAHGYPKDEGFYGKVCHHISNARRARRVDFSAIRDDGVTVHNTQTFYDKNAFFGHVRELGQNYYRNRMARQPYHLEVWSEAAGMVPQLASVVSGGYDIPVYSSSGFDSLTAKKLLADRIVSISKPTVVFHVGDFDPSGEAIFRSVEEDVCAFVESDRRDARASVRFIRLALTAEQVEDYNLPTAPAKTSDSRSRKWTGETCQLEALAPDELAEILTDEIVEWIDYDQLERDEVLQQAERREIAYSLPAPRNGSQS